MNIKNFARTTTAASAAFAALLAAPDADACGGFFCSTQPVVQTGEQIIFTVDHGTQTTEAIININYQGSATDFAWLLPLSVNPTDIAVGPSQAFVVNDQLTRPTFQITKFETTGICGPSPAFAGAANDSATRSTGAEGGPPMDPGVNVLNQEAVGPYDTVTLEGTDPEAVRRWLVENEYRVTDEMMESVIPYVAKGDVLLALKLQKDSDVGDIQPIWLSLPQAEACIPLRLTAIAAQADMDVTATVLSNRGRAIPENYFHVTPNLAKIDWLRGGANYRQIIGDAADEAGGNAFTTEYAGSTDIYEGQLYVDGQYDIEQLRSHTDLARFLDEVQNQGLRFRAEVQGILNRRFSELAECPQCPAFNFQGVRIDPNEAVDEIVERVIEPEERVQGLFDRYEYATRLYTLISPEEMTIDPLFTFDILRGTSNGLPNISNVHNATLIQHCGVGGAPGSAGVEVVIEEDGTVIGFDSNFSADRAALDAMPAAIRIEQLAQRALVKDNGAEIQTMLDTHNARNGFGGCGGCSSTTSSTGSGSAALAFAALLGFGLISRRRR